MANRQYVRFKPANEEQVRQLFDADLELFDYPLDREVVEEGDFYTPTGMPDDDIPWLYTVIDMGYSFPAGITYEILETIYVPDQDVLLENEAMRITGNPEDSCSNIAYRPPIPCELDLCEAGCDQSGWPDCGGSGGGGGTTSSNPRIPAGQILVTDSDIADNVPVRRTRVVARRWFKIDRVYTDDNGRFQCNKKFRNKVNIFVKFRNSNIHITRLIGTPVSRALFPMKRGIGTYSGNLNTIEYIFRRGSSTTERTYRYWWAAQFMNARLEYNEMALNEGTGTLPDELRVVLTRHGFLSGIGATPMNNNRLYTGSFNADYVQYYFVRPVSAYTAQLYNGFVNGILFRHIDMGFGYNTGIRWESSRVKALMYHEMTHAAHFRKVGSGWYSDFVLAECLTLAVTGFGGANAPYGAGNDGAASEIISVGESYAEHLALVFCETHYRGLTTSIETRKQGNVYSFNNPVTGLGTFLNALEDYNPNLITDVHRWIPEGLYYDLFDIRNEFTPILDGVSGYTDQQFFNALDNDIKSMPQFRSRLLQENGNNQLSQVQALFVEYNY